MRINKEELKNIKAFQEEKDKFYLLLLIATASDPLFYSDLETYVIGRSEKPYPTWIWTKDNLPLDKLELLKNDLDNFIEEGQTKLTCKKELYDYLAIEYQTEDYFEMGYLSCKEAIKPLKGKGIFVKPNYADKVTLAEYWRRNCKETKENPNITQQEALETAESWIEDKNFYVLKDSSGEIVCMAGFSILEDLAKITHVYTPIEERKKGYCQYLIYSLAKKLLEDGYKPLLYTDYHYIASNIAYKKVGFQDEGILINFKINK